jgi:hypothetical protein
MRPFLSNKLNGVMAVLSMDDPLIPGLGNHLSTRIRQKAVEMIKAFGRPVAAEEFRIWLRENDRDLAAEMSSKCADYARMILTQTRNNVFVKFRSRQPISGIDRRAVFFGLTGIAYDDSRWFTQDDSFEQIPMQPAPSGAGGADLADADWVARATEVGTENETWLELLDTAAAAPFNVQESSKSEDHIADILTEFDLVKRHERFGSDGQEQKSPADISDSGHPGEKDRRHT